MQCLICRRWMKTVVDEDANLNLLMQLYRTLGFPAVFSLPVNHGIENSDFCENCSKALLDSYRILQKMERLKKDLEEIKTQLKMCINNNYSTDYNTKSNKNNENEEERVNPVRKLLFQCLSSCKVKLVPLPLPKADTEKRRDSVADEEHHFEEVDIDGDGTSPTESENETNVPDPEESYGEKPSTLTANSVTEEDKEQSKGFLCSTCGNIYLTKQNYQAHLRQHKYFAFPCKYCDKKFETGTELNRHFQESHRRICEELSAERLEPQNIPPGQVEADTLATILVNSNFIKTEPANGDFGFEFRHLQPEKDISKGAGSSTIISEGTNIPFLPPAHPSRTLQEQHNQSDLRHLVQLEVTVESSTFEANIISEDLTKKHCPPGKRSLLTCSKCGKSFRTREYYIAHQNLHLGIYPFACEFCERRFLLGSKLNRHIRTFHPNFKDDTTHLTPEAAEGPLNSISTNSEDVPTGQETKSKSGPVSFKCEECGKSYQTREYYIAHEHWHRNIYPFHCHLCNQKFLLGSKLNRHIRVFHGAAPIKIN